MWARYPCSVRVTLLHLGMRLPRDIPRAAKPPGSGLLRAVHVAGGISPLERAVPARAPLGAGPAGAPCGMRPAPFCRTRPASSWATWQTRRAMSRLATRGMRGAQFDGLPTFKTDHGPLSP